MKPFEGERWVCYVNPITNTAVVAFTPDGPPATKSLTPETARLIAAAPALLDGLKRALDALNSMPRRTLPQEDSYELAAHLEALIKQATGKSP